LIDAQLEMEQENKEIQESIRKAREESFQRKHLDLIEEDLILKREEEWRKKRGKLHPVKKRVGFQMPEGLENQGLEEEEDYFEEDYDIEVCVVCGESDSIGDLFPCHGVDCGRFFHLPCAGIHPKDYSDSWLCMTCAS